LGREILVKNYSQLQTGDFFISKRQVVHGATGIVPAATWISAIVSNEYLDRSRKQREFLDRIPDDSCEPARHAPRKFFLSSYGVDIEKLFFDVEDWKKRSITIPKPLEQNLIVGYFRKLDSLIWLHQRKHDKLVALKKAMLQKMFPQAGATTPEIRFKGFSGDWVKKKVHEICGETYGGGTPRTTERKFWEGEIPWIQSSDLSDGEIYKVSPQKRISDLALRKCATKLIPENSIAIVTRVGVGKLALMEFSYAASQDFLSLSKLMVDQSCAVVALFILLQSKLHETQGTSIKGITKEELLSFSLTIPYSVLEQQKIGTYFRTLDELISNQAIQLEKLKKIKSACLEKMFI
jgi:type I restriction enzyme S subunit